MNPLKAIFALVFIMASLLVSATVDDFEARSHTYNGTTLPYRLFVPASYDTANNSTAPYPIILCLHGAGERGTNNTAQLNNGIINWADARYQAQNPCFVVAPQCPSELQWADFPWTPGVYTLSNTPISNAMQTALDMLDSLIREFRIDTDRQYITGLSMGGCGTWDAISRFPNRFAAAAPVCGGVDTTMALTISSLPIWTFHGANDDVVNPVGTRRIVANLESTGVTAIYTDCLLAPNCPTRNDSALLQELPSAKLLYSEYCCIGHFAWEKAYADSLLFKWMALQSKQSSTKNESEAICRTYCMLTASPNPCNSSVNIQIAGLEGRDQKPEVRVYDATGAMVQDLSPGFRSLAASVPWNASGRPSGIYMIKARIGKQQVSKRILLIR